MRRAARTDRNHAQIVGAFRQCGCEVESLAAVGGGVADLLVYQRSRQRYLLVEVKDGAKMPSERRLTPAQVEWHKRFPVDVVESIDDVLALL